jgi:hypothetical protein
MEAVCSSEVSGVHDVTTVTVMISSNPTAERRIV